MSRRAVIQNLRKSILFENVSDGILEKIAEIVTEAAVSAGENLITKGEVGSSMYIVCSGRVKVHEGDLLLNILGEGNAFGEMAALDKEVRTASVTAIEDTELIRLEHDALTELFNREPEVAQALIHFLCQREKHIISDITERSFKLRALEREFEIGRNIQKDFLPKSLPEINGWDFAAYFRAAREVAGDFYDVFETHNPFRIAFLIGDVCGKGVGAALFMALFRSLLRSSLLAGTFLNTDDAGNNQKKNSLPDLKTLLQNSIVLTNNYVADVHGDACMFATLFVALLDPETGEMIYVNAGHEAPVVFRSGEIVKELLQTGPAVGVFPDTAYPVGEITLKKGDTILGFTDGVTEAVNADNEQFSSERLLKIIAKNKGRSEEALEKAVEALKNFTGDLEQFDDITLLEIKRL